MASGENRQERRLQYVIQSGRAMNRIGRENMKNACRPDAAAGDTDKERSGHTTFRLSGATA